MPDGKDPDDFIKQNGKESLLSLLKEKEIIQSFVWNFYLNKIDKTNSHEISKFEKEIKVYRTPLKTKLSGSMFLKTS